VGLKMNEGKTKFITQNIENAAPIKSLSNSTIEHVSMWRTSPSWAPELETVKVISGLGKEEHGEHATH